MVWKSAHPHLEEMRIWKYYKFSFINRWHFQIQELPSALPKCPHTIKQKKIKRCSNPESQLCIKPPDDVIRTLPTNVAPVATS